MQAVEILSIYSSLDEYRKLISEEDLYNIVISLNDPKIAKEFLSNCAEGDVLSLAVSYLLMERGIKFIDGGE